MVPKFPEITQNSLARAQRAVHWTNTTSSPQTNSRDSQQHPAETMDASTHVDYSRTDSFENSKGENAKCCPPLPQALKIKGDVTLGIPHSRLLGRKWRCVGVEWPSAGKSVTNPALESALPTQVNFMQKEWAAFGIAHLHCNDYIISKINNVVHYSARGCTPDGKLTWARRRNPAAAQPQATKFCSQQGQFNRLY